MSIRLKRRVKEETETAPYYMCTEVSMKDVPGYAKLFSSVEHLGHADGVVDTNWMNGGRITEALMLLEKKFASRGVSCAACYADYLIKDSVNAGVYFASSADRESFMNAFEGELKPLSMAEFSTRKGEYKETFTTTPHLGLQSFPGHDKRKPHFKT
jgi:hypothetical protein